MPTRPRPAEQPPRADDDIDASKPRRALAEVLGATAPPLRFTDDAAADEADADTSTPVSGWVPPPAPSEPRSAWDAARAGAPEGEPVGPAEGDRVQLAELAVAANDAAPGRLGDAGLEQSGPDPAFPPVFEDTVARGSIDLDHLGDLDLKSFEARGFELRPAPLPSEPAPSEPAPRSTPAPSNAAPSTPAPSPPTPVADAATRALRSGDEDALTHGPEAGDPDTADREAHHDGLAALAPAEATAAAEPRWARAYQRSRVIAALLVAVVVLAYVITFVGAMLGGVRPIPMTSGDMSPTIPHGSLVMIRAQQADEFRAGDVISIPQPTGPGWITERIQQIQPAGAGAHAAVLKGDNDSAPAHTYRIRDGGAYVGHAPVVGWPVSFMSHPVGWVLGGLIIVLVVAASFIDAKRLDGVIQSLGSRRRRGRG